MISPTSAPAHFVRAACAVLGLQWPNTPTAADAGGDFRLRFDVLPGVVLAIAHEADAACFVVTATFEAASGRGDVEAALLALKANHLRPLGACFSIDPRTDRLVATLVVDAAAIDLVTFCDRVAGFTIMAENWRRMMDAPAPRGAPPGALTTWR